MAITTKTFEVSLDNERAGVAFGLRLAVVDYLRSCFKKKLDSAEDAGVDKTTAMQRFSLAYAGAARGYRLARAIPGSLVQWAGYVEYNAATEWFPKAGADTVGTFDKEALSTLPGSVALIKLGGVNFAGIFEGTMPADIIEIRVGIVDGKYMATVVSGRPDDGSRLDVPMPQDGELEPA
jgi:hypothetical protein